MTRRTANNTRLVGICLLGAVSLLAATHALATTTFPGRNGKIAVLTSNMNQGSPCFGYGVGLVTEQRKVKRLLPDPCTENSPKGFTHLDFSPDGSRLVYLTFKLGGGHYRIAVLNLRTGKQREVLAPGRRAGVGNLSYLADGRIVFTQITAKRPGTYFVRRHPYGRHRLFKRVTDAVSPDGRWFLANLHGRLWLLDSHGHRVQPLLRGPALDPSFSPDGRMIAFTKEWSPGNEVKSDLFVIRRNGGGLRRLTRNHQSAAPTFSPDGRWIAFSRSTGEPGDRANIIALRVKHPGKRRKIPDVQSPTLLGSTWARR